MTLTNPQPAPDSSQPDPLVGKLVGGYTLGPLLARGGMGNVHIAAHRHLDRQVAVKTARRDLGGHDFLQARLEAEADFLARVQHVNVALLYDLVYGDDGTLFVVLELLEGRDLANIIDHRGSLELPVAIRLAREIARGAAALHDQGIVNGDLKPANVMVVDGPLVGQPGSGRTWVKLFDLGAARDLGESPRDIILGSPEYMAPEAVLGQPLDARSDVYGLGMLLYEMLSGDVPFYDTDVDANLRMHLWKQPPPVSTHRADIVADGALDRLVRDCMARRPDARPASMRVFLDRLDEAVSSDADVRLTGPLLADPPQQTQALQLG
ncbi:MAG: serine/threonine-protein kinase [bacterium]